MINKFKTILDKMDNIKYGYVDNNNNIYPDSKEDWDIDFVKLYQLQSPKELIESKYGVCWDQVELERYYLNNIGIKSKSFFIIAHDKKSEPTHTFIVIEDEKYYWLEHSWEPYRGLHDYNSLNELLNDVKNKFITNLDIQNIKDYKLEIYEYDKPKFNINCIDYIKHCETGKRIM